MPTVSSTARDGTTEIAVIGGGVVGMAVALGLAQKGLDVAVFDEGDVAIRASLGNFGLIWVQGKGDTCPEYATWSRQSAAAWAGFANDLETATGISLQREQSGGLFICIDEQELEARAGMLARMRAAAGGDYPYEVLDHRALRELVPEVGPTVAGATWGPEDGHVNPLLLLRAIYQAYRQHGGRIVNGGRIETLAATAGGFELRNATGTWKAEKVVLAAGLGNRDLGAQVGLEVPVAPQRGQVLVGERVKPFLKYPTGHVRQTGEGTIQCGDSKEDVGFDTGTTLQSMAAIARRAVTTFPCLAGVRLIRAWAALRIMSPDGYPIYERSTRHPGAYVVTCHSGITLCAGHAGPIADWVAGAALPDHLEVFRAQRFAVPQSRSA